MANGLCSLPLISTPFWANRYVPLSVALEHLALEAFSSLAYPAPTVLSRAAAPTTSRISARPPAHSPLRFIVVLLLVCRRPERKGRTLWDSLPEGILTVPQCMGDELLHSPTPIGQGPRRGAYIVGYYEVVAGVGVDGLRRRPNMGTSQNSAYANFAESPKGEVRRIRLCGVRE